MKLVILDAHTLNPGDLSWHEFEALGDLSVFARTSEEQILERIADAELVFTSKVCLSNDVLKKSPKLKYIGVLATGVNIVDLEFTKANDIVVTNTPNYTGLSAAQMVFAMILELTNRVGHHSELVKSGFWSKAKDFCFWDYPLVELDGKTIGIVGFGGIGKAVARMAQAFGMNVMIYTRRVPENLPEGIKHSDLDNLVASSDVISLHCPLTDQTRGMINDDFLGRMKESAFLINISRGALVEEENLADSLNQERIAGAALDVLNQEPPNYDCPLFKAKNCYITPHISWASLASRRRLLSMAADNLKSFLEGNPKNVV